MARPVHLRPDHCREYEYDTSVADAGRIVSGTGRGSPWPVAWEMRSMENDRDRKSLAGRLLDKVGPRTLASRVRDPERRPQIVRRFLAVGAVLLILPKAAPSMINAVRGAEADEGEEVVAVDAIVVEPRPLEETLRASGTIRALQEIELTAEVSGIVKDLRIDEGGRVTAGELLVKLNDNDLQAELRGV